MPEIQFQRGQFQSYRTVVKIHLGAIPDDLCEDEVVQYDGQTLKRGGGEFNIPSLRGAIKKGWLLPVGATGGAYRPEPAGVQVHSPTATGNNRGEARTMEQAADDERDLGNRKDVREGRINRPDGTVVGRILPSKEAAAVGHSDGGARPKPIEVGRDDREIVQRASSVDGVAPVRIVKATGDVDEPMAGDELEDVLPGVASSGKPQSGRFKGGPTEEDAERLQMEAAALAEQRRQERLASLPEKAKVSAARPEVTNYDARVSNGGEFKTPSATFAPGSTPVGGEEDGTVVATVSDPTGETVRDEVPPEAIIKAKIEMIQQFVPGFKWDMSEHWQTRVKKAVAYKNNMPVLNAILSLETEAVRKFVMKAIYG